MNIENIEQARRLVKNKTVKIDGPTPRELRAYIAAWESREAEVVRLLERLAQYQSIAARNQGLEAELSSCQKTIMSERGELETLKTIAAKHKDIIGDLQDTLAKEREAAQKMVHTLTQYQAAVDDREVITRQFHCYGNAKEILAAYAQSLRSRKPLDK